MHCPIQLSLPEIKTSPRPGRIVEETYTENLGLERPAITVTK